MSDLGKLISTFGEEVSKLNVSASTYRDAKEVADQYGDILGRLLRERFSGLELTSDEVNLVIKPFLQHGYRATADVAVSVQEKINSAASVGMKAARPTSKAYRIDNYAEKLLEDGADAEFLLGNDVLENVCEDAVNSTFKMNLEKQEEAGLSVRISRKSAGRCCDWCESVSGTFYGFNELPDGFFAMHKDCTCYIDYHVAKVHTRISNYTDADGNRRRRTENL